MLSIKQTGIPVMYYIQAYSKSCFCIRKNEAPTDGFRPDPVVFTASTAEAAYDQCQRFQQPHTAVWPVLNKAEMRTIAQRWHGGQFSSLYQFASSGLYLITRHFDYLFEIENSLHPQFSPLPHDLSVPDVRELIVLKLFMLRQAQSYNIATCWEKWAQSPFLVPVYFPLTLWRGDIY